MSRTDRLYRLTELLRDGALHSADALAKALGVSARTIYRDMAVLSASGFPVSGARGVGYRMTQALTLPPLTLTPEEVEALNLGIAITLESTDPDMRRAAETLGAKIDAALPQRTVADADAWKFATYPFGDTGKGLAHMPVIRAAIRSRQKLRLTTTSRDGTVTTRVVQPRLLEHWGRYWTLSGWCELRQADRVFRLDLIETAEALPELFQ